MTEQWPRARYRSLSASRAAFARAAPVVRYGLFAVGLTVFLDRVGPLLSDGQFTWGERRVMGAVALVTLGGFAAAGWVAGALFRALAELVDVLTDAVDSVARAAHLLESRLAPDLRRSTEALEALAVGPATEDRPARAASAAREAAREGKWGRAEQLLAGLLRDHPGWSGAATLAAEVAAGRDAEVADLRAGLDRAIATENPGRAVACRDALTAYLRGKELHDLDLSTARWVVEIVKRRAGEGSVTPKLVAAVARASESFGDTAEGASLLKSLPELRRRAGLCPDCGGPSHGSSGDCPEATVPARRSPSHRLRRGAAAKEPPP